MGGCVQLALIVAVPLVFTLVVLALTVQLGTAVGALATWHAILLLALS
jgi:hypothetical protein